MKKFIVIAIFFISCNERHPDLKNNASPANFNDSLTSSLIGKWGSRKGEPVWSIKKDSLYYFNEKRSYYYMIHSKDMIVLYKRGPFLLGDVHVLKDTLFFKTNFGNTVKAFRIK